MDPGTPAARSKGVIDWGLGDQNERQRSRSLPGRDYEVVGRGPGRSYRGWGVEGTWRGVSELCFLVSKWEDGIYGGVQILLGQSELMEDEGEAKKTIE